MVALCVIASAMAAPVGPARADDTNLLFALIDAAAQRLQTAEAVAANKWNTHGPIEDPARVQQVLTTVAADASARGIDAEQVSRIFTDQINATEAIEYTRFAQWKLDPAGAPDAAPDLSSSRGAIDEFNRAMVSQLALHWQLLDSPACSDRVRVATDAVIDRRALDPLYRQALSFATQSYCRR